LFTASDNFIFHLINKGSSNTFFNILMPLLSNLGSREFLILTGIILICIKKRELRLFGLSLLVGLFVSCALVYLLKIWIARPRPYVGLADANLLVKESGFSFPSGHCANIFMAVSLLSAYFKKCRYFYILAFLVAISRIYLGLHYPSDCLAGALLGVGLGYSFGWITKRIIAYFK